MEWSCTNGCVTSPRAAPVACTCVSIRPGTTVLPLASMTRVLAPMSFFTSSLVPTAVNTPFRIATACARENPASTVTTLAFHTTTSAASAGCRASPFMLAPLRAPTTAQIANAIRCIVSLLVSSNLR